MSYRITSLKITNGENKSIKRYLPQELRDDIASGYYPYELERRLPAISTRFGKVLLEVDGDYGHYIEVWEKGKKTKTVNANSVMKDFKETL
jgi:hypothetical protein